MRVFAHHVRMRFVGVARWRPLELAFFFCVALACMVVRTWAASSGYVAALAALGVIGAMLARGRPDGVGRSDEAPLPALPLGPRARALAEALAAWPWLILAWLVAGVAVPPRLSEGLTWPLAPLLFDGLLTLPFAAAAALGGPDQIARRWLGIAIAAMSVHVLGRLAGGLPDTAALVLAVFGAVTVTIAVLAPPVSAGRFARPPSPPRARGPLSRPAVAPRKRLLIDTVHCCTAALLAGLLPLSVGVVGTIGRFGGWWPGVAADLLRALVILAGVLHMMAKRPRWAPLLPAPGSDVTGQLLLPLRHRDIAVASAVFVGTAVLAAVLAMDASLHYSLGVWANGGGPPRLTALLAPLLVAAAAGGGVIALHSGVRAGRVLLGWLALGLFAALAHAVAMIHRAPGSQPVFAAFAVGGLLAATLLALLLSSRRTVD